MLAHVDTDEKIEVSTFAIEFRNCLSIPECICTKTRTGL